MFGEKKNIDTGTGRIASDYFMDLGENIQDGAGNDADRVERGCHSTQRAGTASRSGVSDYAFADGSARALKFGKDVYTTHVGGSPRRPQAVLVATMKMV